MQPLKTDNCQGDLFLPRLSDMLNPGHEVIILSKMVNWDELSDEFANCYCKRVDVRQNQLD